MRFYPTKIHITFLCLILISISLNLGCSKDNDLLLDAVIEESLISAIEERNTETVTEAEEQSTEVTTEESIEETFESRSTSFSPSNDAHVQSGKGYNQNIVRLEENHRTSYLMFDLSPIVAVGGTISNATLQITINSDDGSGNISVHKGVSNDWTEESLSENNAPNADILMGELIKEFKIGSTEIFELDVTNMQPEVSTLILSHKNGNDLAFASKEHASKIGPKLVVTYSVPTGSDEILILEEEETTEETTAPNEEPMAVADATPSSGGVPLEVTFKGSNSTDDLKIVSYKWDFKDGSTATSANPTHTFTKTGVYQVELTVDDEQGLSSTDIVTITVTEDQNEAPKAIATATPVSGEAPLEVTLKGSNSTDDNSISSYVWDYKDGTNGNVANPTHIFTKAGIYAVELTVKDENGLTDKAIITITVTEPTNEAPVAVQTANKTSGLVPLDVQFTGINSTDDKEIKSYKWDFKDGATATSANPSHTFTSAGTYSVNLMVKDEEGLSSQKSITITVTEPQNQAPVAIASANPTAGEAPLEVQFLGNGSTDDKAITNYLWNFKDGSTATNSNPSHTFTNAGTYVVDLTVKDAEGASSTKSVTITVTEPSGNNGGGTAPPGYYVSTTGNTSNDGKSPSKPWSLEHAFQTARAGDIVYVKAGNYGNKNLISTKSGSNGNNIRFIGYKNSPGDIVSNQAATFKYGDVVNANRMPLLQSSNGQGTALTLHSRYVQIENFQITGYRTGIESIDNATNVLLKNIVITKLGNQSSSSGYDGFGFAIRGNNTKIENCFVQNANAEGIKLAGSDYSIVKNSSVYADNPTNPTDYYFLLAGGSNNSIVENCIANRAEGLRHGGHGFNIKDNGTYNTFKNCKAYKTSFELTYVGVHNNTIDGGAIYGTSTNSSHWASRVSIIGGAHHNTIKNLYVQDTWAAISWTTFNDRTGADASTGTDNTFENITIKNTNRIIGVGGGTNYNAKAKRNKFINCDFTDFDSVAITYYGSENILFNNCSFKNGNKFVVEADGSYAPYSNFDASWVNCTWSNVNFSPPN